MIVYHSEDISFALKNKREISSWIKRIVSTESKNQCKIGDINIIFCSDNYLLEMNNKYLKHNYFTDIITFDYCESDIISGDLFISIDTVKSNSFEYKTEFLDELFRVIIHGILHLLGFNDSTAEEQIEMKSAEERSLSNLQIRNG